MIATFLIAVNVFAVEPQEFGCYVYLLLFHVTLQSHNALLMRELPLLCIYGAGPSLYLISRKIILPIGGHERHESSYLPYIC